MGPQTVERHWVTFGATLRTRIGLWLRGRRDGRRRAGLSSENGFHTTVQTELLNRYALEFFDWEHRRAVMDSAVIALRADDIQHRLPHLRDVVDKACAELDRLTAAGPATQGRVGEEGLDPAIVTRRRRREHRDQVATQQEEVATARHALRAAEAEMAEVQTLARRRMEEGESRAVAYSHFVARLQAVYWRAFLRSRRRSPESDAVRPTPAPWPSWVLNEGSR